MTDPAELVPARTELLTGREYADLLRCAAVSIGVVFSNVHDEALEDALAPMQPLLTQAILRAEQLDLSLHQAVDDTPDDALTAERYPDGTE